MTKKASSKKSLKRNSVSTGILLFSMFLMNSFAVLAQNAALPFNKEAYSIESVGETDFEVDYVTVDGYPHRIAYAGNPKGIPVVMMTGFPEDDLPSMRWLVDQMTLHPEGQKYRYIMVQVPYLEEYSVPTYSRAPEFKVKYAEYDGTNLITHQKEIYKDILPVDPRFDHENQAKTYYNIIRGGLGIEKAHFVGHDRGAVITDYMLGAHPELALSYSRGSQAWKRFDEEWHELGAKGIIIGPPHDVFATNTAKNALKSIMEEGSPFLFTSAPFRIKAAQADPTSELGKRWLAIQEMKSRPEHYFRATREMFRQSNLAYEVGQRIDPNNKASIVNTKFPLMHFQGEDELIQAKDIPNAKLVDAKTNTYKFADLPDKLGYASNQISEQPWFGKYNWFEGEIVNLKPSTIYQSPNDKEWKANVKKYVKEHNNGTYKTIQTVEGARFNRFSIIPDAVHFSHIENPKACAWAILDFINNLQD